MVPKLTEKQRNLQIRKEAIYSWILYIAFFLWWYFTGYGIGERTDPSEYKYVLGLPMWFFISCVVGYVLFCVVSVLVVKLLFKDFDLEEVSDEE